MLALLCERWWGGVRVGKEPKVLQQRGCSARLPRRTLHEVLSLLSFKARVGFEVCSEAFPGR